MSKKNYTISIAGSTAHTALCAQALLKHPQFSIPWILTPTPKPVGRKKTLTKNPFHQFAEKNSIPVVLVEKKINEEIKKQISKINKTPNFLLVIDFGYLIPDWLLKLPTIAPVNIHPSNLPRWRGSSPGQYVLLNAEPRSAVCLIHMTSKFDQGPIINKQQFEVNQTWTQTEYYQYSFDLISQVLPEILAKYAAGEIEEKEQPVESPTQIAWRLKKKDGFIDWQKLSQNMQHTKLNSAYQIEQKCRAFQPWPMLWTIVPTSKGDKRMKIFKCHVEKNSEQQTKTPKLVLDEVQIEGKNKARWNEVKNIIL